MSQDINRIQEDEIDLKELWKTLIKAKKLIIIMTSFITILAILYALKLPKIYEVSAMIQVGKLGLNTNTNTNLIENPTSLVKKLEITSSVAMKKKKELPYIDKIEVVTGTTDLIKIYAQGLDNASCIKQLDTIIETLKKNHQQRINEYLSITNDKFQMIIKQKNIIESEILEIKNAITKQTRSNVTLASLILLKDLNTQLAKIDEEINAIKLSISENNIKNSEVIGGYDIGEFPVKPKKKLIVIVAFVAGLILSILLVFFLEFIRNAKESEYDINTKPQH